MVKTNAEQLAWRGIIKILAKHSTPKHRDIMINKLLSIEGGQTTPQLLSLEQLAMLFWSDCPKKQTEALEAMRAACESGELGGAPYNQWQRLTLTELALWSNCPPMDSRSPLRYWQPDAPTEQQTPSVKPVPRGQAQDAAILKALLDAGYDPEALPKNDSGRSGVKKEVRDKLDGKAPFEAETAFDDSWKRLRWYKDIKDKK